MHEFKYRHMGAGFCTTQRGRPNHHSHINVPFTDKWHMGRNACSRCKSLCDHLNQCIAYACGLMLGGGCSLVGKSSAAVAGWHSMGSQPTQAPTWATRCATQAAAWVEATA